MGVAINIENVTKRYGSNTVIKGLSTHIKAGEFFTLLGPSGCGKTTLLRMIIGFNTIEDGQILVDGKLVNSIPTNKRNMGMVFQNYAVFPHMTVRENVAYGLKTRKLPKDEIERRVSDILKLIRIAHRRQVDRLISAEHLVPVAPVQIQRFGIAQKTELFDVCLKLLHEGFSSSFPGRPKAR